MDARLTSWARINACGEPNGKIEVETLTLTLYFDKITPAHVQTLLYFRCFILPMRGEVGSERLKN